LNIQNVVTINYNLTCKVKRIQYQTSINGPVWQRSFSA